MEKRLKISSTAYRVLLLLQKLNEKNKNADELNELFLDDPDVERIFSKDVILKYISTLRLAGYDISRPSASNNYCYELNKAPVLIDFSDEEIRTLVLLKSYAEGFQQNKHIKNYYSFLEKIKRYMCKKQIEKLNEQITIQEKKDEQILNKFKNQSDLIKKIEQYLNENQNVEIKYKLPEEEKEKLIIVKLLKLKYKINEVAIIYCDLISNQMNCLKIDYISYIKQLPSISGEKQVLCSVIFKLKGKLAKTYRPYEGEKITVPSLKSHELTVTAYCDDIETLLKRLLKYGENCEVLYPKQIRNNMINTINNALKNYTTALL
ncbi:MAG TPA: WYL domain-containing protein [Candidatus Gastranaerophilales bacterium]|nr:WYL domain-containing protein [Candidatus Gastranaerophilales bacterium]